jgi:hypothetical protein
LITKLIRITADALPAPAIKKPKKKSAKKVAKKK